MAEIGLTMGQALVRYLCAQQTHLDGETVPLFAGVFAIFGHGNVSGLGEALYGVRDRLPTLRAHNEQAMTHAAIAFAKTHARRRMMACTTSIGPGATNMVTAAALAHVNRLPVLLLPGETFASRAPDPVLQQIEHGDNPNITANDCFRPVSRYWDRITRPEQLLTSLPNALSVLTDPGECGPVTLAMPQDVQTQTGCYPEAFFQRRVHTLRRLRPDHAELQAAIEALRHSHRPLIVSGGGVHYALATQALAQFSERFGIPVAETQAGKGALPWNHPCQAGAIGVTGSSAANQLAAEADLVIAIGTRLSDFTTASRSLFAHPDRRILAVNVARLDSIKHGAQPLVGDVLESLQALTAELGDWKAAPSWTQRAGTLADEWQHSVDEAVRPSDNPWPSDAQVLGAVNRAAGRDGIVVCSAGGLPGELHKLWRAERPDGYHLEYGYSCMGYEIAGGLGVKMARPDREVYVMVGDGSYLMLNSEIVTSLMYGHKLIIVLLDNRGFGCIHRLQQACGDPPFNNLLNAAPEEEAPAIDFAAHARSLGAHAQQVDGLDALATALEAAKRDDQTHVIVIRTDPDQSTEAGGAWWDVPIPEHSDSDGVRQARRAYETAKQHQRSV